jgi:hypothetical protein
MLRFTTSLAILLLATSASFAQAAAVPYSLYLITNGQTVLVVGFMNKEACDKAASESFAKVVSPGSPPAASLVCVALR